MKRWKGHVIFNIYVNHLGDICLRKRNKSNPDGGVIFATTQCPSCLDEEGYPVFQGVRGVCAKITFQAEISFEESSLSHVKRAIFARLDRAGQAPLEVLLLRRQQLLEQLSEIKRGVPDKCFDHEDQHQAEPSSPAFSPSSSSSFVSSSPERGGRYACLSSDEELDDEKIPTAQRSEMKRVKKEVVRYQRLILFRYRKDYGKDLTGVDVPAADTVTGTFVVLG
jgi:hypothetical protein